MTPNIESLTDGERPFIAVDMKGSSIVQSGAPRCALGHKIDSNRGSGLPEDGIFAEWGWDGENLTVRNDRYGIYPLFYAAKGRSLILSPSITKVLELGGAAELDYGALSVYFRLGFFLSDDTPFRDLKTLPPSSRLTWCRGKLTLQTDERARPTPKPVSMEFDQIVDRYAELFSQAISRRLPNTNNVVLPLSGGRDSRHILLELSAQGCPPTRTVTVHGQPSIDDEDTRLASWVAEAVNIPHDRVSYPASHFAATMKDITLTELCSSSHAWLIPLAAYLASKQVSCTYDGLAGDILSSGLRTTEEKLRLARTGKTIELAKRLLDENNREPFIQSCFQDSFNKRATRDLAIAKVSEELKRHLGFADPISSFFFWNLTRRGIALLPFGIHRSVATVYCPFLDHDLFDFLINVDPSCTSGKRLHDAVIHRYYPEYRNIPFEYHAAKKPSDHVQSRFYRRSAVEAIWYLLKNQKYQSCIVKKGRFLAMLCRDAMRKKSPKIWYLHPLVHGLEIERAIMR